MHPIKAAAAAVIHHKRDDYYNDSSDSDESSIIIPPPHYLTYRKEAKEKKKKKMMMMNAQRTTSTITTMGGDDGHTKPPSTNTTTNPFGVVADVEEHDDDVDTDEDGEEVMTEDEEDKNDDEEDDDDDDEDIIESSKRLLRCVDQRIHYQEQNDEIRVLKDQAIERKIQAEAMAEQLRRAIETKCDLVLAQNEMERRHEQNQITKDTEVKDLRTYIQDILETQARSELNFMNEISTLARNLDSSVSAHQQELYEKEKVLAELDKLKACSVRDTHHHSSRKGAFRNKFSSDGSASSSVSSGRSSKKSISGRSHGRMMVHPLYE